VLNAVVVDHPAHGTLTLMPTVRFTIARHELKRVWNVHLWGPGGIATKRSGDGGHHHIERERPRPVASDYAYTMAEDTLAGQSTATGVMRELEMTLE